MAASITPADAKQIASLPRSRGRLRLAVCLGWDPAGFGEEDHLRESILLDYLHDSLAFAAGHGFPWSQVCASLDLARALQEETVGQPLSHAVRVYRERSAEFARTGRLSPQNLSTLTGHLFATFMQHHRLYQYVFTKPRSPLVARLSLDVEPPPDPLSLKDSKPENIWEYNQRYAAIQGEEEDRLERLEAEKEEILRQVPDTKEPLTALEQAGKPIEREDISQAVREAAGLESGYAERLLQTAVERSHEGMDFYLERTALPRPAGLGPPPRTKSPPRLSSPTPAAKAAGRAKTASSKASGKNSLAGDKAASKGSARSSRSKTAKSVKS